MQEWLSQRKRLENVYWGGAYDAARSSQSTAPVSLEGQTPAQTAATMLAEVRSLRSTKAEWSLGHAH